MFIAKISFSSLVPMSDGTKDRFGIRMAEAGCLLIEKWILALIWGGESRINNQHFLCFTLYTYFLFLSSNHTLVLWFPPSQGLILHLSLLQMLTLCLVYQSLLLRL